MMKTVVFRIHLLVVLGLLYQNLCYGQQFWTGEPSAMTHQKNPRSTLVHQLICLPTASEDTNRVLLYVKLSNETLQFIKSDSIFTGRYELTVAFQNEQKEILFSEIKRGELTAATFMETESPQKTKYEFFETFLSPGVYSMTVDLYDLETREPVKKKAEVTIPDFQDQVITSTEIIFLKELNFYNLTSLMPLMPPVRASQDTNFCARIDLFAKKNINVTIFESILNHQGKVVYHDTVQIQMTNRRHPVFFKLNHDLPFGRYSLQLKLSSGETEKILKADYYIRWYGHPTSLTDIEMAIGPLFYIMDKEDWQKLQSSPVSEQKQLLEDFWKQRDPVRETTVNELEDEYYRRVAFANSHFSIYRGSQQGWKTDRGRIYILYGPPTDVDIPMTHNQSASNYEIWIYQNLNQRFVFYDKYKDGDYRLIAQE